MVSKLFSVAALAGAAMAACPLSVDIVGVTDHTVQVAVKNTANEAVTVFKGNTVLSEHATKDLLVSDANNKALPFEGVAVNYMRKGLPSTMFQTFQPGETFTTSVNAAKTYNLAGVAEAKVTALQGFKYVTGTTAPTSLKEMEFCQAVSSGTVSVVPDQSKVAADKLAQAPKARSSRIKKRDVTYASCSDDQVSQLQTSVSDAISMSGAARDNAGAGNDDYTVWFKDDSEVGMVQSIYSSVTTVGDNPAPQISCADINSGCSEGIVAYTLIPNGPIVPCDAFWSFPELAGDCSQDDLDRGGSILHEMTHLFGTADNAYGQTDCMALSAADAANNADTYEIYAGSVRLGGCSS